MRVLRGLLSRCEGVPYLSHLGSAFWDSVSRATLRTAPPLLPPQLTGLRVELRHEYSRPPVATCSDVPPGLTCACVVLPV